MEYTLPTIIHIAGGIGGILSGTAAALFQKGSVRHKRSGYIFVASMVVMAIPAALISYIDGKHFDVLSSFLTLYLILTGWLTFRLPPRYANTALTAIAALCFLGYITIEINTSVTGARATDAPVGAGYVFASIMGLALWGDLTKRTKALSSKKAVVRHVWRMCFGFFMATANLFGVRPHLFPEWMQSSGLLVFLAVAPLLLMLFWSVRLKLRPLNSQT